VVSSALVAAHWLRTFNIGQLETVRIWLDALPGRMLDAVEASDPPYKRLMFLRATHVQNQERGRGLERPGR
jgi:hypothetical protein